VESVSSSISGLYVTGGNVYWSQWDGATGDVRSVPSSGGNVNSFLSAFAQNPGTIVVDTSYVWFVTSSHLYQCSIRGCGGVPTAGAAPLTSSPGPITQDSSQIYLVDGPLSHFSKALTTEGPLSSGAVGVSHGIDVDSSYVYFSASGNTKVGYCALPSCTGNGLTTIAVSPTPQGIAAYGGSFFVVLADGSVWQGTPPATTVSRLAPPQQAVSASAQPMSIAVDATGIYWTVSGSSANNFHDGFVAYCPPGCTSGPYVLASNQTMPTFIALDSSYVYWATYGSNGSILRVAK